MFSFGCAKQQNYKMPETAYDKTSNDTKSVIVTGTTLTSEGVDKALSYLIRLEKYLLDKIEELKQEHPEKVAEFQANLDSVRTKITEYKRKQWKELTNSLGL